MRTLFIDPNFESWRNAARTMLAACVEPDDILWSDDSSQHPLFGEDSGPPHACRPAPKVSSDFLDLARTAAAHTDPRRWALLYRLAWRHTHGGEKHLLQLATDAELRVARQWCKQVGREIHKMHAFVRFRLIGTEQTTGREQFVAWFEPEYAVVRMASPFFVKRYHSMDWSILTPSECAHWDGCTLVFTAGLPKDSAPHEDALDDLWRTYYRSIFNPARLKVNAMQSEMPKKYWKNLPEARLIPELISNSRQRMRTMLETDERPVKPAPRNAYLDSLRRLNEESKDGGPM
jgi:probable DNA metabolism protein